MSRVDHLNRWERAARARWLANAAHHHFAGCDTCHRQRDSRGEPMYVARQRRSRKFQCLECWEFGPRATILQLEADQSKPSTGFSPTAPASPITGDGAA